MAKETLLQIVQSVLNDIDGDEVNSISDTTESEQVAVHVKNTYKTIISNTNWPHTRRALTITARSDSAFPTHMTINEDVKKLLSIFYNKAEQGETRKQYKEIEWLEPDDFLRKLNARNNDESNVDVVIDDSGIELLIMNDKAPDYFTSFDDVNLIFDSYDSEVDSTLQDSKFQAQGFIIPEFTIADDFVPDLPSDAFALLTEKSIARCQLKMRQMQDVGSEIETQRQSRWLSQEAWTARGGIRYPDYGRKRNRYGIQRIQPWE